MLFMLNKLYKFYLPGIHIPKNFIFFRPAIVNLISNSEFK